MAELETDATDISARAAEVATDVSETNQEAERRRLVTTFTRAAVTGARAAGRGTRAVQRRAGDGTTWLADHVVAMAPRRSRRPTCRETGSAARPHRGP